MAFNVTQCPVCESTFNTSARILESALGRVRCGACLAVFDAAKNYVEQTDADAGYHGEESVFIGNNPQEFFDPSKFLTRSALTEADEPPVSMQPEISGIESGEEEDLFGGYQHTAAIGDDPGDMHVEAAVIEQQPVEEVEAEKIHQQEGLSERGKLGKSDEESTEIKDSNAQEIELAEHSAEGLNAEPLEAAEQEGEFAESPGQESGKEIHPTTAEDERFSEFESAAAESTQPLFPEESFEAELDQTSKPNDGDSSHDEELKSPILDRPALDPEQTQAEPPQAAADEPSFTIEEDVDAEQEPKTEYVFELQPQNEPLPESTESANIADAQSPEERSEESSETIRARALEAVLEDEEALEALPEETLAVLEKMSTPLELPLSSNSQWGRRIALSFAILFLGASLMAQYLWQAIDVYSQQSQIRPFYELTCNWLNCELPPYSEIGAIRSDSLVVRSHPEIANGLMVNTTIRNTADFPQAFPIMVLSFNSASNSIVALREFAPAEYLDPGLQSFSTMPVMTPVQIDLEIIDPGPGAVNYTLAFRLP